MQSKPREQRALCCAAFGYQISGGNMFTSKLDALTERMLPIWFDSVDAKPTEQPTETGALKTMLKRSLSGSPSNPNL